MLARLVMFYSRCRSCMCCGAAELRGNLLLPAGSWPGWMSAHGFLWDGAENLNMCVFTPQPLGMRTDAGITFSCLQQTDLCIGA